MDGKKLQLKAKHTWKCKPGHSICVLDRGVVRFEYPSSWIVEPKDGALHHGLGALNYWTSRAPGLERVWDEVLNTLVFGVKIEDPTAGPSVQ